MMKKVLKPLSFIVVLALVLSMSPMPVFAEVWHKEENTFTTAVPIALGQRIEIGNTATQDVLYQADMKYKFVVPSPSVVTLEMSTYEEEFRTNVMTFNVFCANTTSLVYADHVPFAQSYGIRIDSSQAPISKTMNYKLLAGTYYVTALSSINAHAALTFKSIVPMKDDTLGEPNDNVTQSINRIAKPGVTYSGMINYYGKSDGNSYSRDKSDYFKFVVPKDNTKLKLTASRADNDQQNNITFVVLNQSGSASGFANLPLLTNPSGSVTLTGVKKGSYYLYVEGWPANATSTEYTFRIDDLSNPPKVAASRITLNKSKVTLKKGKTVALKVSKFTPSNTTPKTITWTSSNSKVASVGKTTGKVKGVKKGTATITAKTWNGKTAKCKVTVK